MTFVLRLPDPESVHYSQSAATNRIIKNRLCAKELSQNDTVKKRLSSVSVSKSLKSVIEKERRE